MNIAAQALADARTQGRKLDAYPGDAPETEAPNRLEDRLHQQTGPGHVARRRPVSRPDL